jgi:hypothetical protein
MDAVAPKDFANRLSAVAADIETLLERLLSAVAGPGEIVRPQRLLAAMRHAVLGGGKRLRPFLLVETATLFGAARERALLAGAALECLHGYSLVHDDLPAMDDDELRRGRPTVHKAFGEATAILAGDALLTLAFDVMARDGVHPDAGVRIDLVLELARAAGIGGMAGGQMLDLSAEGRFGDKHSLAEKEIVDMQVMKTGALIRFAAAPASSSGRRTYPPARPPTATALRSARPSRSPTICSISKATRKQSARPPTKTPPPARPRWWRRWAHPAPALDSRPWSPKPKPHWRRSPRKPIYCAPPPTSSPNARRRRSTRWPAKLPLKPGCGVRLDPEHRFQPDLDFGGANR